MLDIFKKVENILLKGGIEEYSAEAKLIIKEVSNLSYGEILLGKKIENEEEILNIAKKRAKTKIPIQYLLGFAYFMDDKYLLDKNVLIPRDETQILVEQAYNLIKNNKDKINVLDIGIGSGCISCALAKKMKNYDIEILGVDISADALNVAIENINRLDLIRKVLVRKSDIFSKIRDCEKFDLIISNPPYIPIGEKNNLQKEVKEFEPSLALFAQDKEGVEFYKKIIMQAPKFLKKDGKIIFEIGINQSKLVQQMFFGAFGDIKVTKDLAGIERVISAQVV